MSEGCRDVWGGYSKEMMKRVLVTGGRGYIGSVLCARLTEEGYLVYCVDDRSNGDRTVENVCYFDKDVNRGFDFLNDEIDVVFHLAALVDIAKAEANPLEAFERNTMTTKMVVDFAIKKKAFLIYASSGGVYGDVAGGQPLKEIDLVKPKNVYSETKYWGEKIVEYGKRFGLRALIFRFFNVVGGYGDLFERPGQGDHILPKLIDAARNDLEFLIYGTDYETRDGTTIRDYVHVLDIIDGLIKGMGYLDSMSFSDGFVDVFNLGTRKGTTVKELIDIVREVTGKNLLVGFAPRRQGDPVSLFCDNYKAKSLIGWEPKRDIRQAIRELYNNRRFGN